MCDKDLKVNSGNAGKLYGRFDRRIGAYFRARPTAGEANPEIVHALTHHKQFAFAEWVANDMPEQYFNDWELCELRTYEDRRSSKVQFKWRNRKWYVETYGVKKHRADRQIATTENIPEGIHAESRVCG